MPKPNQKTVTINKETYSLAEKKARKQKKSVAGFVSELILEKSKEA
jgi:predicted CopG family antitoxin